MYLQKNTHIHVSFRILITGHLIGGGGLMGGRQIGVRLYYGYYTLKSLLSSHWLRAYS